MPFAGLSSPGVFVGSRKFGPHTTGAHFDLSIKVIKALGLFPVGSRLVYYRGVDARLFRLSGLFRGTARLLRIFCLQRWWNYFTIEMNSNNPEVESGRPQQSFGRGGVMGYAHWRCHSCAVRWLRFASLLVGCGGAVVQVRPKIQPLSLTSQFSFPPPLLSRPVPHRRSQSQSHRRTAFPVQ